MPVTDFTGGSDWNSPYRMPPGWTTLPDGSVGPSSQVPDWLKQLIPSPGAGIPNAPGGAPGYGTGPGGVMPGGGLMGRQAVTPGAPSMGFPAQGGPQVIPPQNSAIPNNRAVGPFTGGQATENMPGGAPGGSNFDPRNWFRANPGATFQEGSPMGPDVTGGGGWPPGLSTKTTIDIARGGANFNPYARAAIAAGGIMAPTPTANDQAPTNMWMQRPSGVGGMPGPGAYDPLSSIHAPSVVMANAPPGQPSATPRPGVGSDAVAVGTAGARPPLPPRRPTASASSSSPSNPRFGLYQSQVPGMGAGPLSRNPIYTTLNLFGGRS